MAFDEMRFHEPAQFDRRQGKIVYRTPLATRAGILRLASAGCMDDATVVRGDRADGFRQVTSFAADVQDVPEVDVDDMVAHHGSAGVRRARDCHSKQQRAHGNSSKSVPRFCLRN